MNTLATRHPASGLTSPRNRETPRSSAATRAERRGSWFLVGSLALHALGVVIFSVMPGPAHASNASHDLLEVDFIASPPQPEPVIVKEPDTKPEPQPTFRKGSLDASAASASSDSAPADASPEKNALVEAAPAEVLAIDNPYASADAAIFTKGSAGTPTKVVQNKIIAASTTKSSFGTAEGSSTSDSELMQQLAAWRQQVRAQLASLARGSYPRRALRLKQEGTTKVTVTIDESGNLIAARISSKSGVASLDQNSLSQLQAVRKVLAPPKGAGTNELLIPMTYSVN